MDGRKRRVLDQIFAAHAPTPLELKRKLDEWSQNRTLFTPQPLQYERVDSDSSTNSLALSSLLMQAATSEEQQIIEGEPQQQAACHRQDCTCRGMLSNGTCSIIGQLLNSNPDLQRPQVESREWRAARVLSHGDSAVYQYLDENACEDLEDLEPNDLEHEAADERANAALLEECSGSDLEPEQQCLGSSDRKLVNQCAKEACALPKCYVSIGHLPKCAPIRRRVKNWATDRLSDLYDKDEKTAANSMSHKEQLIWRVKNVFHDLPEHQVQAAKNAAVLLGGKQKLPDPRVDSLVTANGRAVVFVTSRGVYLVMLVAKVPGMGYGRKLMAELIEYCTNHSRRWLLVTLQACLRENDGFYKKMGFQMWANGCAHGTTEFAYELPHKSRQEPKKKRPSLQNELK